MKSRNSDRIIALIATIVIHLLIIILFVWTFLTAPDLSQPQASPDESELILEADEYVIPEELAAVKETGGTELKKGDDPMADGTEESQQALDDRVPTAKEEVRTPPADQPSKGNVPVKSSVKDDKKSKEEQAKAKAKEAAEREKAERDASAAAIRNNVKFNGSGSGDGKQGSKNGNSTQGASTGAPGHNLAGRTVEAWGKPSSTLSGTIRIRVRVNAQGRVISASYAGGSGSAAGDMAVRRSCERASMNSRFSVSTDNASDQTGVITWHFQ